MIQKQTDNNDTKNNLQTIIPLTKEDYITINLCLFRDYTECLKLQATFTQHDPIEWRQHIIDKTDELVTIQRKIHKIIMTLSENNKQPLNQLEFPFNKDY